MGVGEKSSDETLTVINPLVVPSLRRRSLDEFVMKPLSGRPPGIRRC